jgi:peptidoglycan hydrolase-like amidase
MDEPTIAVGICDGYPEIRGRLNGPFRAGSLALSGGFAAVPQGGAVALFDTIGREILRGPEIRLTAGHDATFTLQGVTIGVKFHWERREEQTFGGSLTLLTDGERLAAVNELPLEAYLTSVIASEMNGGAPFEFLKAHAVTSRSWLMAMLARRRQAGSAGRQTGAGSAAGIVRWYDREDHARFDVCADDHCQRYQGITGRITGRAAAAVGDTRGVVLVHAGEICDARYHKACGGLTEDYATCWEERVVPYLSSVADAAAPRAPVRTESDAEGWILSRPDVYCRTEDRHLLARILPSFDQETTGFFRWEVTYGREELEAILRAKSGLDFGILQAIVPQQRGPSGRIRLLRIEGSAAAVTVGKELEIRRWLSPSHLLSSAFVVRTVRGPDGTPASFTLHGAGWGHGVGLCQIGAAVMAERGRDAGEILRHYFRGAALVKRY